MVAIEFALRELPDAGKPFPGRRKKEGRAQFPDFAKRKLKNRIVVRNEIEFEIRVTDVIENAH